MAIECPEQSCGLVVGGLNTRLDSSDKSLTELHARLRDTLNRLDSVKLRVDDHKGRMVLLEAEHRNCQARQSDISQRVELLEKKLDDLRLNLQKVVQGQIDILNSNAATREQFSSVLATMDAQHMRKMKLMRRFVYIGGALALLATQIYARWEGHETILDALVNILLGGTKT